MAKFNVGEIITDTLGNDFIVVAIDHHKQEYIAGTSLGGRGCRYSFSFLEKECHSKVMPQSTVNSVRFAAVQTSTPPPPQPAALVNSGPKFGIGDEVTYNGNGGVYRVTNIVVGVNGYTYDIEELMPYGSSYTGFLEHTLTLHKRASTPPLVIRSSQVTFNSVIQKVSAMMKPTGDQKPCTIVENQAGGNKFLYCRTHDDEADSMQKCRKC